MASDVKEQDQTDVQTCLQCRVCKLCHPIGLKENATISRHPNGYWIAVSDKDGCMNVSDTCKQSKRGVTVGQYAFEHVSSIAWKQVRGLENLYILDNEKNIREYSLQGRQPPVAQHWSFDKLQAEIITKVPGVSTVSSLRLVGCASSTCLLLVNNSLFVSLLLADDGTCHHIGTLDIPECHQGLGSPSSFQIVSTHLVVLAEKEEALYIFDFVTGCMWGHIDLQFSKLDLANRMQWRVSHDFVNFILIGQDWMLHTLALDVYVKTYPKSLKTEPSVFNPYRKQLFLPNHSTCNQGDSKWRLKLRALHEQQHLKQKTERKLGCGNRSRTAENSSGRKKITGFRSSRLSGGDRADTSMVLECRELPTELHEYSVVEMVVGRFALTLSLVGHNETEKKALCVLDFHHHKTILKSISKDQVILLSSNLAHTHLIVSDVYVFHVVTEAAVEQEDLVSKLMLYGGASAADKLCDFNKWGRCTVPLHTLQIGIQHRQLDTVAFFLKTKENLFISSKQKPSVSPSMTVDESQLWETQFCHTDNIKQLESALSLLVQAVKENVTDQQSRDFANKLLTLTLEFLYTLVHNGLSLYRSLSQSKAAVDERADLEKAVDLLMGHIAQLRQCLTLSDSGRRKLIVRVPDSDEDVPDGSVKVASWSHFVAEEAVEAATMKNELPLLQTHLLTTGDTSRARYDHLVSHGVKQVLRYLNKRDMKPATQMLENMGFDVPVKLWELAESVKERELQMFIVEELQKSGSLNPDQIGRVDFLWALYNLYPCGSFSQAMLAKTGEQNRMWSEESVLASLMTKTSHEINSVCGDIGMQGSLTNKEGLYAEVLLDWLKSWDQETRERILLEGQFQNENFILEMYPNRKLLWRYLLSHNRHDDALTLLDLMIREVSEDGSSAKQRQDCVADLYNDLDLCTQYLETEVTRRLMRKGYIQSEMLTDFPVLMEGLSRVGGVLCSPHPLHHIDRHTLSSFHQQFLAYCAQYRLVLPLWIYCTKHRQQLDQSDVEDLSLKTWLTSLQHFFSIARNPEDTDSIFQASLSCAAHIWKLTDPSLAELINHDHVTASIATLPYSPTPIQQTSDILKLEVFEGIDQEVLQSKLHGYPKLYSALFPTGNIDSPRIDVNVYQLLVGSAPLDPRRLFGWQDGNCVAGEECLRSLPFFSDSELVSRFAYTEKIRYPYYLKHGRPTYAFLSFLAEELDSGATTISSKRIYTGCGVALWIAVKNFTNPTITSACVAFVEMSGQDSLLLRSYIQAGNDILVFKNTGIMGNVDKRKEVVHSNEQTVVDVLQSCVRHRRQHGPRLIELLERATSDAISRKGLNSTSFDAAHLWFLTISICHQLHLPLSTAFLEDCARSDTWLPFLWFSQCHQYPKQQLQGLLHHFRSRHLRDHLHYVIENADAKSSRKLSSEQTDPQAQTLTKDVRSSLYAKIGVSKGRGSGDVSSDEEEEQRIMNCTPGSGSAPTQELPVNLTLTEESAPEDVFQVVFSSQSSASPWKSLLQAAIVLRNSLFAELAACHPDAPVEPCLCGWLVAMMDRTEHAQFMETHGKSPSSWNMAELEFLIDVYIRQHWEYTLATGFDIFQTDSPLLPFLKFLAELTQRKDYAACTTLLGDFKESMSNFSQGRKSEYSQQPVLGNSQWLEQTSNRLLQQQLVRTSNLYEAVQLVQLLDQENIALVFSFDVPDYSRLRKLVQILHANNLEAISIPALLTPGDEACSAESRKTVSMLIDKKTFTDAYKFAHLTGISCDDITLQEMLTEKAVLKETLVWKSKVARSKFWKTCANKLRLNQVSTSQVIEFFKNEAEEISAMSEKAAVHQLCLELLPSRESADSLFNDIYRQMWKCRIQARIDETNGENTQDQDPVEEILSVIEAPEVKKLSADKSELLSRYKISPRRRQSQIQTSTEEMDALDSLVDQLLDEGKIRESHQVTTVFQHYCQDLAIILTCIGLSQGEITRETMEPDMRRLLTVDRRSRSSIGSFSGFPRTTSAVSLASIVPTWDFLPVEKEDIIAAMEKLLGHCNHGQQCCLKVITAFKVACVLDIDYEDAVKGKEFSILDELLRTTYPQRFILARDYLSTSSLSDDQGEDHIGNGSVTDPFPSELRPTSYVASFLSVSIIKGLKRCMGGEMGPGGKASSTKELMFNPTEGLSMLNQFVKLCQDPSLLGDHLLEAVSAMGDNSDDTQNSQSLSIQTELLIMAHEYHTVACSMEGISNVLRAARICTDSLAKAEEFSLMIRLLTGVGRFSEMTYIFDALKHHHQFELLLRKGMEKEGNLKTAVLDYLKRFHPDDKDSYTMVALKFTMYREIAHMLEENGQRNLHAVKDKPLENTREIQEMLKESARYFSDAAESYVKDNCLRHAQQCLRQARLLALQLQHLASGIQVINLSPEGVTALIAQHPKFMESLIVSEAYGKRADWSDAIYHNVIIGNDFRYLQDLKSHIHLTSSMIQDAIARFQQSGSTSPQAISNIKKLLPFCKDICLQYRIAKDLQMNEVTHSMLKSDAGSYLQDMMSLL